MFLQLVLQINHYILYLLLMREKQANWIFVTLFLSDLRNKRYI